MGYLELGFPYDLACVALVDLLCGQGLDLHGAGWFGLVNVYRQFNWSLTFINPCPWSYHLSGRSIGHVRTVTHRQARAALHRCASIRFNSVPAV